MDVWATACAWQLLNICCFKRHGCGAKQHLNLHSLHACKWRVSESLVTYFAAWEPKATKNALRRCLISLAAHLYAMKDLFLFSVAWSRYCTNGTWFQCPETPMTKCQSGLLHSRAEKFECFILHLAGKSDVCLEEPLNCLWLVSKLLIWTPCVKSRILFLKAKEERYSLLALIGVGISVALANCR